jgi:hypothetical protein
VTGHIKEGGRRRPLQLRKMIEDHFINKEGKLIVRLIVNAFGFCYEEFPEFILRKTLDLSRIGDGEQTFYFLKIIVNYHNIYSGGNI